MTTDTTPPRTRISKRLRFEILTRDNYTCRYCGRTKDEVKLAVDHVIPEALGGPTEPSNLVTACEPCNSGKSSTSPTAEVVADVDATAVRWRAAMQQAADEVRADRAQLTAMLNAWRARWDAWTYTSNGEKHSLPLLPTWDASIRSMLESGADLDTLIDFVDVAMQSKARDPFRYFCGCAWNHVRALQERARELLDNPDAPLSRDNLAWAADDTVRDAYWSGHVAGYSDGYEDGWESGQVAGRNSARTDQPLDAPMTLAAILQPPKDG